MIDISSLAREAVQGSFVIAGMLFAEMGMIIFRSGLLTLFTFVSTIGDLISQNKAFKIFGQGNIRRWRQKGLVEPVSKRPGKIEYRLSDLRILQQRKQDYFE